MFWPDPPTQADQAGGFVDAYACLKLEMDWLKKHEDELDFFVREMQCRRVLQGFWKGFPIAVYGGLCDYGRSYLRPLLLVVVTVFVGTLCFGAHFVGYWSPALADLGHTGQAVGLSFANTFGVLGLRKDLIKTEVLQGLPGWLIIVSTVQTVFGTALLFLFGLGLRNRFRMK